MLYRADAGPSCQRIGALRRLLEWRAQVVAEEVLGEPGAQVVALGVEEGCRLLPDRVGRGAEDRVEHRADGRREVARVARVVDEDPVGGEAQGIAGGRTIERQAVVAGEHGGRADRQRIERLGLGRQLAGTGGEADVEAAEGDPDRPGDELGGEGRRVGRRFRLGLVLGVGVRFVLGSLGVGAAPAEALGDGAAVLLVDAVQVEAALVDLGLDRRELGVDRLDVLGPGGGAGGERAALDLEQRRQDEGVARLGPGVEAALERPGAAGERGEGGLVGRREVGDGGALDDADHRIPAWPCAQGGLVKDRR